MEPHMIKRPAANQNQGPEVTPTEVCNPKLIKLEKATREQQEHAPKPPLPETGY